MPTPLKVPALGESITEAIVANWLKSPGDRVEADESVVELETDKITVEVPAPCAGVLLRQLAETGATVSIGDVIAEIGDGDGKPAERAEAKPEKAEAKPEATEAKAEDKAAEKAEAKAAAKAEAAKTEAAKAEATSAAPGGPAMPAARAEATRAGVELERVPGTGRGGRVLKEDVQRAAKQPAAEPPAPASQPAVEPPAPAKQPAPAPASAPASASDDVEIKTMTPLRRRIAERLVQAQQDAAILTTFNEVDMSAVFALRKTYQQAFVGRHEIKLGFMSFFIKAAVSALQAYPGVNAEIRGNDIHYHKRYDIGVAVGGGKGLVVPVVRGCDRRSFADIELEIKRLAGLARTNKLTLGDLTGGTFTISNGGIYGSMLSTPILNPPQSGILGLHNIVERPVAVNGQVVIRPIMYLALSYDHRLIDGREAVQFLIRVKECIEDPSRLLLDV
ncbi:MAG: 2-oxoglutarate dehydrogenase complex dihydrolipoyllysine-residue succinyltransferase [Myxococcales bacterium]|nr:2-oxoglutarate dehydrogenase complex dihydrolipoyllysine-residue succinyltransferase [Myxococcales bacterium]